MSYFVSVIKYVYKNLRYLILFVLLPAVFVGYFLQPFCLTRFLSQYSTMQVNDYYTVFKGFFNFSWQNVLLTTIGFVFVVFILVLLFGYVERHMRTGKFALDDARQIFNGNILVVGLYCLLVIVLYMLLNVILSLIIYWLHLIISGIGLVPNTASIVVAYVVGIVGVLSFFRLAMHIFLSIPQTLSTGYSLAASMREVGDNLSGKAFKAYFAYIIPLALHFPLLILSYGHWWYIIALFVLMVVYMVYYLVLTYVVYFDIMGLKRNDNDEISLLFRRSRRK